MNFFKRVFSPVTAILSFIQKYFKSLIFLVILFLIFGAPSGESIKPSNLMKIELNGPIFESEKFLSDIKDAEKSNIKGVLVVVNSPGGAVAPSIEISLAVKRLKEKKPVIAYAGGIMAKVTTLRYMQTRS